MFDDFTKWLDGHLNDHEPSAVLKAAVGLMAFASLLGAFFGSQAVRVGAFVVAVFFMMSGVLLLLADRRRVTQARDGYQRRLDTIYKILSELSPEPLLAVDFWEQRVEIMMNGDVHEVLTIEAVTPRDQVFFARLTAQSLWNQPKRHLRRVRMTARGLKVDGSLGPSWHIVSSWDGGKLYSYLDLDPPLRQGKVIRFQVERTWPAKCQPMMRNKQAENFLLRTTNVQEIRRAEYSIVLPAGLEAVYELIGEGEPDVQLSAIDDNEPDGRKVYKWYADKVPADTGVGIRLQLK